MRVAKMSYYINTGIPQQCFSKINTFTNHMEILLRRRFWFHRTGVGQIFCCFFYKLPSDPGASGPQTSLWVSRPVAQNISQWTWICVLSLNLASPHMERFFEFNKNWNVKRRAISTGNAITYLQLCSRPISSHGLMFWGPRNVGREECIMILYGSRNPNQNQSAVSHFCHWTY